jgi:predicted kinase
MSKQLQRLIAELKAQKEISAVFERGQQNACDGEDAAKEYAAELEINLKAVIERVNDWLIDRLNNTEDTLWDLCPYIAADDEEFRVAIRAAIDAKKEKV